MEYLIQAGSDIEARFKDGFTPIYIGMCPSLVDLCVSFSDSVLLAAAQKGHRDIVELLIEKGACIEARGGDSTPVYVGAQNGHNKIVEILIRHGADIEAKYKGHYTPLYITGQ